MKNDWYLGERNTDTDNPKGKLTKVTVIYCIVNYILDAQVSMPPQIPSQYSDCTEFPKDIITGREGNEKGRLQGHISLYSVLQGAIDWGPKIHYKNYLKIHSSRWIDE